MRIKNIIITLKQAESFKFSYCGPVTFQLKPTIQTLVWCSLPTFSPRQLCCLQAQYATMGHWVPGSKKYDRIGVLHYAPYKKTSYIPRVSGIFDAQINPRNKSRHLFNTTFCNGIWYRTRMYYSRVNILIMSTSTFRSDFDEDTICADSKPFRSWIRSFCLPLENN